MRYVNTIGASKGDKFLDLTDYKRVLESICEKKAGSTKPLETTYFLTKNVLI